MVLALLQLGGDLVSIEDLLENLLQDLLLRISDTCLLANTGLHSIRTHKRGKRCLWLSTLLKVYQDIHLASVYHLGAGRIVQYGLWRLLGQVNDVFGRIKLSAQVGRLSLPLARGVKPMTHVAEWSNHRLLHSVLLAQSNGVSYGIRRLRGTCRVNPVASH